MRKDNKILYEKIMRNISEKLKYILNEDIQKFDVSEYDEEPDDLIDHQTIKSVTKAKKKNNPDLYRNIKGTRYIWHGEWSDPEVRYKRHSFNINDIEDLLWERYTEECKYELNITPTNTGYEEWLDEHPEEIIQALNDLLYGEYM